MSGMGDFIGLNKPQDPPARSGRDDTPPAGAPPSNSPAKWEDELSGYLGGEEKQVSSSNVASSKYDSHQHYLEVGFLNGARYGYHDVSSIEATNFLSSKSKGGWVWDNLRRRGTVFGYQKPYAHISGQSEYSPKYYGDDTHREEHRSIGPGGHTPASWQAGAGPYHPSYGVPRPSWGAAGGITGPTAPHGHSAAEIADMTHSKVPMAYHAGGDEAPPTHVPSQGKTDTYQPPSKSGSLWGGIKGLLGKASRAGQNFLGAHFADGGEIFGDPALGDNVNIKATAGEGILTKEAMELPGVKDWMERLNKGRGGGGDHYAAGGWVNPLEKSSIGPSRPLPGGVQYVFVTNFADMAAGGGGGGGGDPQKAEQDFIKYLQRLGVGGMIGGAVIGGASGAAFGTAVASGIATGDPLPALIAGVGVLKDKFDLLKDTVISLRDPAQLLLQYVAPFAAQVSKWSPASIERMQLSLDNLSAAAGVMFEPIVEAVGGFADELNVLYTELGVPIRSLVGEALIPLKQIGRDVAISFAGMVTDTIPTIRNMMTSLTPLVPILTTFGQVVITTTGWIVEGFGVLASVTGWIAGLWNEWGPGVETLKWGAVVLGTVFVALAITTALAFAPLITLGLVVGGVVLAFGYLIKKIGDWTGWFSLKSSTAQNQAPISGDKTAAAQNARQVGIEQVGLEARAAAFSQGASVQERHLSISQEALNVERAILAATLQTLRQQQGGAGMFGG